jgi:hypothetical protein
MRFKDVVTESGGTYGAKWEDQELVSSFDLPGAPVILGAYNNPIIARTMNQFYVNEQDWYRSSAWQKMEKEADEALLRGEIDTFDNMDDFINTLYEGD